LCCLCLERVSITFPRGVKSKSGAMKVLFAAKVITLFFLTQASAQDIRFTPHLAGISVAKADSAATWYSQLPGCKTESVKDFPDHNMKIGVVVCENFKFELVELQGSKPLKEVVPDFDNPAKLQIIGKLTFRSDKVADIYALMKNNGAKMIFDLRETKLSGWGFICADPDGNWIQFVER
jgi:hypothetical protein